MQCLRLVPWGSLIATVFCWAGVALFCGGAHEALSMTLQLLNDTSLPEFNDNSSAANV